MTHMQEDFISVIIPTYNRAHTIRRSVDSVLNQTHRKLEVLVVDDGSTDQTERLFLSETDSRVRYVRYSPNRGACYARNHGVSLAKGAYIAFQDSDDQWAPEKLEKELAYMKETGADMVFCGMNRVHTLGGEWVYYPLVCDQSNMLEQVLTENVASTQTLLVKRDVLNHVRFDTSFRRFQDWDFVLQVLTGGFCVRYLEEALVSSETQADSISVTVDAGTSCEQLFRKYRRLYQGHPRAMAAMYRRMGEGFRKTDREKTKYYWRQSLRLEHDWRIAAKLVLYSARLRQ